MATLGDSRLDPHPEDLDQQQEGISALRFVAGRAAELARLEQQLGLVTSGFVHGLQRLPRRMRRHAASHNPKRLPLRLRKAAFDSSQKRAKVAASKRLRRLYRRRNRTRLAQNRTDWLSTHLWHAKRFHMVTRWGYRLAERPTDKTLRPCLRAAAKGVLLHDASYLCPFLLTGPPGGLAVALGRLLSPEDAARSRALLESGRQFAMTAPAHAVDRHPRDCLGPVRLYPLCRRPDAGTALWLWCHPLISDSVKAQLEAAVADCPGVAMETQRDRLCCFRLTGPASDQLLGQLLHEPEELSERDRARWHRWRQQRSPPSSALSPSAAPADGVQFVCPLAVVLAEPNGDADGAAGVRRRRDIELVTPQPQQLPVSWGAALHVEDAAEATGDDGHLRVTLLRGGSGSACCWDLTAPRSHARRLWLALTRLGPPQVAGLREAALAEADPTGAAPWWAFPAAFPDSSAVTAAAAAAATAGKSPKLLPDGVDHLLRDRQLLSVLDRLLRGRISRLSFRPGDALALRPSLATAGVRVRVLPSPGGGGRPRAGGTLLGADPQLPIGVILDGHQSTRLGRIAGDAVASLTSLIGAVNAGGGFGFRNPRAGLRRGCRVEIVPLWD